MLVRVVAINNGPVAPGFANGAIPDEEGMPTQLRMGPNGSVQFSPGLMPEGWRAWSSGTLVADVGCYAFQIDTARATDHIMFEVVR